jgi:RNA polymerase sigma factor (sigma-70 family)
MAPTMTHADRGAAPHRDAVPPSSQRDGDVPGSLGPRPSLGAAARPSSDSALVASLRRGNEGAFDTLVARYQTRLSWFCWQILRSKEDVEDALQDVFTSAYNAILADDREIQVQPWLYRIARNRCIKQLRRSATRMSRSIDDDHADAGPAVVDTVVGRQRFRNLIKDVQALPDTQRTALLLCEIDGLSYQQIALAMSTTVPAVKSLLVRARTNLRGAAAGRDAKRCVTVGAGPRARKRAPARPPPISYQSARAAAIGLT